MMFVVKVFAFAVAAVITVVVGSAIVNRFDFLRNVQASASGEFRNAA